MTDSELLDLIPFFERLTKIDSVYSVLCNSGEQPYFPNAVNRSPESSRGGGSSL